MFAFPHGDTTLHTSPAGAPLLIVEDHPDVAASLRMLTTLWGYECRVARDGDEAVSAVRDWCPAVVIMDLGLPRQDGYAVASRLRHAVRPEPRFVAYTGYGMPSFSERSRREGFDGHLLKASDPGELRLALERLVAELTSP